MEICGMSLAEALKLLLHHEFTKEERAKRLKIKKEISQNIVGKNKEDAAVVVNQIVEFLKSIRDNLQRYSEIGVADLLSLINSKSESLKKSFTQEVESRIRWVISWEEWNDFPPESSVHIFRL